MPILHVQYDIKGQTPDGQTVNIPPAAALQRHGPLVQVNLGIGRLFADQLLQQGVQLPPTMSGNALIDTGASSTCIDEAMAANMGLPVIDIIPMASASHAATLQNVYPIHMQIIGSPITVEVPNAIGANLQSQGIIALIGRDYLQHCTFHYNGVTGAITLSI